MSSVNMSSVNTPCINITELRKLALESKQTKEERDSKKQLAIQKCKDKLENTCKELDKKLFDKEDYYSIPHSFTRACSRNGITNKLDVYINFNIKDFSGWNKFVPYENDGNGRNIHARPANCLKRYLTRAQCNGMLPKNIDFDVWGNKKFTVKFTIHFDSEEDAYDDETSDPDAEMKAINHP